MPKKTKKSVLYKDPFAAREARRYTHPIASREAILTMLGDASNALSEKDIAKKFALHDEESREALRKRLAAMVRDGQLLKNRKQCFAPASKLDLVQGSVLANADGFGFLRPDQGGEDLYLSPYEMRKVLHGDRVLASIIQVDRRGRRKGAIVEVLERRVEQVVGRVMIDDGVMLVSADDPHITQDVLIKPQDAHQARDGDIVVAHITQPPTSKHGPIGKITTVLGKHLTPSILVNMALANFSISDEWPRDVMDAIGDIPDTVSRKEAQGRVDLCHMPLVTIDGEKSRDFDDAVFAEKRAHGGFRLVVAIADVAHYVAPESALDEEALARGTSVYFPDYVVPMLPTIISNGICSLNPDKERLCLVCDMSIKADGSISRSKFYQALMRSHARLTYDEVWQALDEDEISQNLSETGVLPQLQDLHACYKLLRQARDARGAIDFDTHESRFALNADGEVVALGSVERNDAHRMIEEAMIAANICAARFLERHRLPALYRVHAYPPAGKYEDLQDFLRAYKLSLPPLSKLEPGDYKALLAKVRQRPEFELVQSVLLRSMALAAYMPEDHGHFGLALEKYAHFTAPIRRYSDLLVHRAIHYALAKGKRDEYLYTPQRMAALATHVSQRERIAEEAERDVDERYKCAWMERHVGSAFDGTVSSVTSFGLFVDIQPENISGLVHISQLPDDYYHFDALRHLLEGEHHKQIFRQGDRVKVQVVRASMEERKIDLRLLETQSTHRKIAGKKPKHKKTRKAKIKGKNHE